MASSFYIIDGSAYIYRAYHAIRNLTTSRGMPTNAIYGVTQMLLKIMKQASDYLVVAFDAKGPTFRHTTYPLYKANRPPMPDDLAVQIPFIHRVVSALGIPIIIQEGVEADDLIGTLAKQAEAAGLMITIVSGDKDLLQLVSPSIRVYDTLKEKILTPDDVRARFGVLPHQLIEIMGLMGDAVDNIPGVRGIGEKTAIDLIGRFGTIEALLSNLDAVEKKSVRKALEAEQESARLSRDLATIRCDCPILFDRDLFLLSPVDKETLVPLCEELEFTSLLKEFAGGSPSKPGDVETDRPEGTAYPTVDVEEFSRRIETMQEGSLSLALIGPEKRLGLGVLSAGGEGFCTILDGAPFPLFPPSIRAVLESDRFLKIGHDLKAILLFLQEQVLSPPFFDTQMAAYLLDPARGEYPLAAIAERHLQAKIADDVQMLSALLQLKNPLAALLDDQDLFSLFRDIELPVISVLAAMEKAGVKINLTQMAQISADLHRALTVRAEQIYALAGKTFNINSPKQLGHILFDVVGLHPPKKTKTGYSTDEEVLTQLAAAHELPEAVLAYRQEMKLKTTYVDPLLARAGAKTARVHTTFHQTVTATGRLSSSNPNLQNIPIRGEWGSKIRETFIVEPKCSLLVADYNQIELRLLAHLSNDPALIAAYCRGDDLHRQTAMELFGLPSDQITPDMRRVGKTVNFGIIYGISPFGLASQLGILHLEARRYMEIYFSRYPGVQRFMEETIADVQRVGYVTTLFKRRRSIPEMLSPNKKVQEAGARLAVNTRIQGSAADIIKWAMRDIFQWMRKDSLKSRMILQVHDELLFEVPEEEMAVMREGVVSKMENVMALAVPLTVDVGSGANWHAAHG